MKSIALRILIVVVLLLIVGVNGPAWNCQAADPPIAVRSSQLSPAELAAYLMAAKELRKVERAAHLKLFREEFETAKALSVRERLERAATVTGELAAMAEKLAEDGVDRQFSKRGFPTRYAIYPRKSHVLKLFAVRPWLRDYEDYYAALGLPSGLVADTLELRWPTMDDQAELRQLLNDNDPDIQVMAAEALATLYDPKDFREIRQNIRPHRVEWYGTGPPSIPVLSSHYFFGSGGQQGGGPSLAEISPKLTGDDRLWYPAFWQQITPDHYRVRALRQLSGADATDHTVGQWWATDGVTRESLWYWQYRIYRELRRLELVQRRSPIRFQDDDAEVVALRKSLRSELAGMDRLVEAKLLLLMPSHHPQLEKHLCFQQPWLTRLTKDELFQLLDGDRLWNGVNWPRDEGLSASVDAQLAYRILTDVEVTFTQEDVPRLRQLLRRTTLELQPSDRARWHIAISRLLPLGSTPERSHSETCDGYLRTLIEDETQKLVHLSFLRELLRVGLPNQVDFLGELFFQKGAHNQIVLGEPFFRRQAYKNEYDPIQMAIIATLDNRPLTDVQQILLWNLVLDDRFRPYWLDTARREPRNIGFKGKLKIRQVEITTPRLLAINAINAHAGRDLITTADHDDLSNPDRSTAALDRVLERLRQFATDKATGR
jgi:hypothetical protein